MLRVLIVDDDYNIREGLKKLIDWREAGCEIVGVASDAFEAMQCVGSLAPDVVITDIRMPEMDGLQFIRQVQSRSVQAQFIILSAYPSFQYAKEAIRSNVVDYLVKPVDEKELIEVLDRTKKRLEEEKAGRRKYLTGLQSKKFIQMKPDAALSQHCVKALSYIMEHYADKININELAGELFVNSAYLGQLFRKETGYAFRDFVNRYRISCAVEILAKEDMSFSEVAELIGYHYPEHFYREFKRLTGKSPKEYTG